MNPRIQALAEQAAEWASQEQSFEAFGQQFTEKFTELIVRECAGLFALTHTDEQPPRRIDTTILRHFDQE
jgi:hypothetical protein